jgi:hypothetical protein
MPRTLPSLLRLLVCAGALASLAQPVSTRAQPVSTRAQPVPSLLQEVPAERIGTVQGVLQCAPNWVRLPSGERYDSPNPVARALEFAAPGAVIEVLSGTYPALQLGFQSRNPESARTAGGQIAQPIVVRGRGQVRFDPGAVGDTIAINQQQPCQHVWFESIDLVPGSRCAVMFYDLADNQAHVGFRFYDCRILGGWNHTDGTGVQSKWGVLGHDLSDFVFAGRERRAEVRDIRLEHAFYLQSPRGDITLENIDAARLGRCFVQLVAREQSGPPGRGLIVVRGNRVSDVGLSDWDGFKGGSAYTFAGGLEHCTILVERNTYRAGFERALLGRTTEGRPYGTAAFVAWDGGEARPNGTLVLRGNDFELADNCGDRALVSIGACERVVIEGDNRFVSGAHPVALALESSYVGRRAEPKQNGRVHLSAEVTLRGDLTIDGRTATAAERRSMAVPIGER